MDAKKELILQGFIEKDALHDSSFILYHSSHIITQYEKNYFILSGNLRSPTHSGNKKKKEQVANNDLDDEDEAPVAAQPTRDRSAKVLIFGDEAQQDFKKIGSIKEVFGGNGMNLLYEIFDAGGRKIAEAEARTHSTTWQVVTLKNNKAHTVTCASFKEKEAIMEYLTRLRYL